MSAAVWLRAVVALVVLGGMPMVSDAREYFDLGDLLTAGGPRGAYYWPPGESVVLAGAFALSGKSLLVARLVTIAESVAGVALTALLARALAGRRAARVAGWVGALYAPSVLLCGQTYSQHLASLCLVAVAYFGLRAGRERRLVFFALTGAALGLGCLTRPSMASVVPVVAVTWWWTRGSVRGPALAVAIALAIVAPVLVHDAGTGAGWTLSTNNERNLFLGNNPYTPDYKTSHLGQRALEDLPADAREYLRSFYDRPDAREAMEHEALSYMASHPLRTAWRTLNRTTSFWGFDYLASREIQKSLDLGPRAALPLLALEAGSYIAVLALAVVGFLGLRDLCDPGWRTWLVALALGYAAPYALAFSGGTYHFPVIPLVLPFAAVTLTVGVRRRMRTRSALAALVVVACVQAQYAYHALRMSG
jgi:4-amino-4-deoxy-L-arabinose transferase-like glycosyltransferase